MGRGTQTREARVRRRLPAPLAAHQTLAAALLLALPVLIYLWPALVGGKVFSPDAVLYKLAPWQGLQPSDVASYENYLLADVPIVLRPWRELARSLLHDGVLPLWNPHALTGVPFISNPQTGLFSPFALPLWVLPFGWALGAAAALKLWVGGLGAYLLARELRLGFLPGLLAGVAFAFSSQNVMWLAPEIVPGVAVLLPWMLWLVERLLRGGGTGNAVALACVTAAALGGGHPGTQVHVLVAAGLYALLRTALGRERAPPSSRAQLRPLALALGGLAVGVALMGALMLPEILSSRDTVGTLARRGGRGTLPGLDHMPFGAIRTPLFPDWWGRPSGFETPSSPLHSGNVNYQERTFYAGVVALLLAAVGFTNRSALRRQAPLAIVGALGLAIALHAPGLWWLAGHLPPLSLVENQRLHFVFELAVAVLAAFGLQAVLERPHERGRQLAVALVAIAVGASAALTSGASAADAERVVRHFLTGRDFARTGVVELTAVAWFLVFALGVLVALLVLRARPGWRLAAAGGLVLLAALDAFHFAHGYNPMAPPAAVPPRSTPAIAYLQQHRSEGRVVGVELALPPEVAIRYELADVRGYAPPFPTKRFLALWRAASPAQEPWLPTTFDQLTPAAVQVTGALGARFVVANAGTALPPAGGDPALGALERVYAASDATIFRNPRAAPRAFVPAQVETVPDAATANATLADSAFDASRTVVVEQDQPGHPLTGARGSARIVAERNAAVTLRARLDRPGVVVLADQLLDGWSVRVDGRPARPLRVNAVLRGVAVDAGTHTIEWRYRVPGLRAGVALSSAAALLLLAVALAPRVRRQRSTSTRA
ncbi:MAG TPA: hypothetical protein VFS37_05665 [Conexibacter sp.]|nr:hypothetical protein [Conexibacter sp.]